MSSLKDQLVADEEANEERCQQQQDQQQQAVEDLRQLQVDVPPDKRVV